MIATPVIGRTAYETLREELEEFEEVCHLRSGFGGEILCGERNATHALAVEAVDNVLARCTCTRKRCTRCAEIWFGL